MNWTEPRHNLIISRSNINTPKLTENNEIEWTENRKAILNKYKFTCKYCGGFYKKYLYIINNLTSNDVCCRLCYLITHINFGFFDEMILCFSNLSQLDIVRKTVNFIIHNKKVPTIIEIDPDAKKLPISLYEFSNILSLYQFNNLPRQMKSYKIFFSLNVNTDFIAKNYFDNTLVNNSKYGYMFIDDDSESSDVPEIKPPIIQLLPNYDNSLKDYIVSADERDFFINFFS